MNKTITEENGKERNHTKTSEIKNRKSKETNRYQRLKEREEKTTQNREKEGQTKKTGDCSPCVVTGF